MKIKVNLDKAKAIADDLRRNDRNEQFKPLDIQVTIPDLADKAEKARAVIRKKDGKLQKSIKAAKGIKALEKLLVEQGIVE